MAERFDFIYCECWGDIVGAFEQWRAGLDGAGSPAIPYSAQFFEFGRQVGARVYGLSGCLRPASAEGGGMRAAHHPRKAYWLPSGLPWIGYHLKQLRYAALIVRLAIRFRPSAVFVDSGVTHLVLLAPLRLLGVRVIAVLHNSIWPNGFPPGRLSRRLLVHGDRLFFRHVASAVFCVSPVIRRQVAELAGSRCPPLVELRGAFDALHFQAEENVPAHAARPFRVVFAGRVERTKGVFDLLEAAGKLDAETPAKFVFDICGDGAAMDELRSRAQDRGLTECFRLHGRLERSELLAAYRRAHVVVVPTRSDFCEGFALVVAEAILLGRPVITNSVVPALEELGEAIVEVKPDDPASIAEAVARLADDAELFAAKRSACKSLRPRILDRHTSFLARLLDNRELICGGGDGSAASAVRAASSSDPRP
jgi:glycosyltransferase involved in cell wall biosynthesis